MDTTPRSLSPSLFAFAIFYGGMVCIAGVLGNKQVALGPDLPMRSLDDMSKFHRQDWTKINPLRGGWIERFNKEVRI